MPDFCTRCKNLERVLTENGGGGVMCEACKLRDDDFEASALLSLLMDRAHVPPEAIEKGRVRVAFDLTSEEVDWFCAWGSANEDAEVDDPAEEDLAPEESEQLESGYRLEAYEPVKMKPARCMSRKA